MATYQAVCQSCGETKWPDLEAQPIDFVCSLCRERKAKEGKMLALARGRGAERGDRPAQGSLGALGGASGAIPGAGRLAAGICRPT